MATLTLSAQGISVHGRIDYDNAQQVYQQGLQLLQNFRDKPVYLDLSALEQGSTLALAVFIQWLRACSSAELFRFTHVPAKMLGIISASHLDTLIADSME